MENELIFSKEWFMLEKYHFKIMAVITELADNTGTFKGELTAFCENLSIQNSSGSKNKIKAALSYLERSNYISMSVDKKIYTAKLTDISDSKNRILKLKKSWYQQLRTAKTETSWENLLKIFLVLLELSKVPDNIVTYKQRTDQLYPITTAAQKNTYAQYPFEILAILAVLSFSLFAAIFGKYLVTERRKRQSIPVSAQNSPLPALLHLIHATAF